MPLLMPVLTDAILRITDARRFAGYPRVPAEVAANWAGCARAYFERAAVPGPSVIVPGAHVAAEAAMRARMVAELATVAGPTVLGNAFSAYALALAAAALPGIGVIAPPPGPPVLPPLPPVSDPTIPAVAIAQAVDAWARLGTFTTPALVTSPWV